METKLIKIKIDEEIDFSKCKLLRLKESHLEVIVLSTGNHKDHSFEAISLVSNVEKSYVFKKHENYLKNSFELVKEVTIEFKN
jgi:hypothetical protein